MRRQRRFAALLGALLLAFLSGGCGGWEGKEQEPSGQQEISRLKVTFFDVGKGDAILLETEGETMLIDTGYDDTADVILDYLEEEEIRDLDWLVITHFDKDHVGGADRILEAVEVERVLEPDYESDSGQTREYKEALEALGLEPEKVTDTLVLDFPGTECTVYPPKRWGWSRRR